MHYSGQDMLWLIGSLSNVFRLPFDAHLVRQQFPPPYSHTTLLNALQTLDFKVGEMKLDEQDIAALERIPYWSVFHFLWSLLYVDVTMNRKN